MCAPGGLRAATRAPVRHAGRPTRPSAPFRWRCALPQADGEWVGPEAGVRTRPPHRDPRSGRVPRVARGASFRPRGAAGALCAKGLTSPALPGTGIPCGNRCGWVRCRSRASPRRCADGAHRHGDAYRQSGGAPAPGDGSGAGRTPSRTAFTCRGRHCSTGTGTATESGLRSRNHRPLGREGAAASEFVVRPRDRQPARRDPDAGVLVKGALRAAGDAPQGRRGRPGTGSRPGGRPHRWLARPGPRRVQGGCGV